METKQKLLVKLLTGRTIEQGVGKEQGKTSKEYFDSAATCLIDPADLEKLRTKENSNVLVSTKHGSVVVKAQKSLSSPHAGMIFVPYGPWANVVVETETNSTGMPSFKGIPATIEAAPDRQVANLKELLKDQFGK